MTNPTLLTTLVALGLVTSPSLASAQVADIDEVTRLVFAEADTDGDGHISPDEVVEFDERLFATADADTDGFLDAEEFVVTDMGGAAFAREQGRGDAYDAMKRGLMRELDRSGDERVSRSEFLAGVFEQFRRADRDEDARIDEAEFSRFTIVSDGLDELGLRLPPSRADLHEDVESRDRLSDRS